MIAYQVDKDGPWHVFASGGLVVVDVDALQLEVGGSDVGAGGVDSMFVGNDLPELEELRELLNFGRQDMTLKNPG